MKKKFDNNHLVDRMWKEMIKEAHRVKKTNKECANPKGLLKWIPTFVD